MSAFGGIYFTNRGRALQVKAQTGIQLNFTRIAVGDGNLGSQTVAELTNLVNEIKSLSITRLKTMTGDKALVGGVLSNNGLLTGFYWREVGIFAQDPDLGEVLYCYGNAGALAEYIPSQDGADIMEKQINIITLISNAASITASIDSSLVYASEDELMALEQRVEDIESEQSSQIKIEVAAIEPSTPKANMLFFKII